MQKTGYAESKKNYVIVVLISQNYYIIFIIFLYNSKGSVLHCGDDGWDISTTNENMFDSRWLAKRATWCESILILYIIKTKSADSVTLLENFFAFVQITDA